MKAVIKQQFLGKRGNLINKETFSVDINSDEAIKIIKFINSLKDKKIKSKGGYTNGKSK